MSNVNFVCFSCRTSKRVGIHNVKFSEKCPICGGKLENVGYKTRIPNNTDIKEWKNLESQYRHEKINQEQERIKNKVRMEAALLNEIAKLEEREENKERRRQINVLEKRLQELRNKN